MLHRLLLAGMILTITFVAHGSAKHRTIVVREKGTASLLNGKFELKLLKINGYSIEVRALGTDRVLQIGQSISPKGADCLVIFEEIATETRLARFSTNCR